MNRIAGRIQSQRAVQTFIFLQCRIAHPAVFAKIRQSICIVGCVSKKKQGIISGKAHFIDIIQQLAAASGRKLRQHIPVFYLFFILHSFAMAVLGTCGFSPHSSIPHLLSGTGLPIAGLEIRQLRTWYICGF